MYDLVHVLDGLSEEITRNLKEMTTCRDIDERKKRAEIIKTLCESLGIFFDGLGMMEPGLFEEYYDDDEFDDDVVDFSSLKKGKKNKNKKKKKTDNDIPF